MQKGEKGARKGSPLLDWNWRNQECGGGGLIWELEWKKEKKGSKNYKKLIDKSY